MYIIFPVILNTQKQLLGPQIWNHRMGCLVFRGWFCSHLGQIEHIKETTTHYRMNICLNTCKFYLHQDIFHILPTIVPQYGTQKRDFQSKHKNGSPIISVGFVSPQRICIYIYIHKYTYIFIQPPQTQELAQSYTKLPPVSSKAILPISRI